MASSLVKSPYYLHAGSVSLALTGPSLESFRRFFLLLRLAPLSSASCASRIRPPCAAAILDALLPPRAAAALAAAASSRRRSGRSSYSGGGALGPAGQVSGPNRRPPHRLIVRQPRSIGPQSAAESGQPARKRACRNARGSVVVVVPAFLRQRHPALGYQAWPLGRAVPRAAPAGRAARAHQRPYRRRQGPRWPRTDRPRLVKPIHPAPTVSGVSRRTSVGGVVCGARLRPGAANRARARRCPCPAPARPRQVRDQDARRLSMGSKRRPFRDTTFPSRPHGSTRRGRRLPRPAKAPVSCGISISHGPGASGCRGKRLSRMMPVRCVWCERISTRRLGRARGHVLRPSDCLRMVTRRRIRRRSSSAPRPGASNGTLIGSSRRRSSVRGPWPGGRVHEG